MATISETVYSEFEVAQLNCIFANGDVGSIKCVGKFEESMETKTTSKKCRGVVTKKVTRGTGTGTGKVTAHLPKALYYKLHDMEHADLASGVRGYGYDSTHPQVCVTGVFYDEDGTEKYKAYPCAVVSTGPSRTVENGAEEVAECELEFAFMPDANGHGVYEAETSAISSSIKNSWLTAFNPALVAATAMGVSTTVLTVAKGGSGTVTISNAVGTPAIYVKQVGAGVTATKSNNTLTIAASASATVGEAWVEIVDEAGAKAVINVTVTAS